MTTTSGTARTYDNSRRRAEVERQRQAVVQSFVDQLMEPGTTELSISVAAEAAGVSARTVHRYFPDHGSRMHAVAEWVEEHFGPVEARLETVDDFPDWIRAGFRRGQKDQAVVRMLYKTGLGNEVRARYLAARRARYAELLTGIGAAPEPTRRAIAAVSLLASAEAGIPLVDVHGLTTAEAAEVAAQAVEAIVDDLRRRAQG